jgi:hypothetical protein
MPFFVRGASLVLDLLGASAWAAGLVAAHFGLAQIMGSGDARGALAGGILAGVVAVAAAGAGIVSRPAEEESLPPRMATP